MQDNRNFAIMFSVFLIWTNYLLKLFDQITSLLEIRKDLNSL